MGGGSPEGLYRNGTEAKPVPLHIIGPKVVCAVCPNLYLCLECLATGTETNSGSHASSHAYRYAVLVAQVNWALLASLCTTLGACRILPNLSKLFLFDKNWNAEEELLLLDGITMYGLGNFRDVSTHVHSKTEAQCLSHYMSVYLKADTPGSSAAGGATAAGGAAAATVPPSSAHVPKTEIGGYFPLRGDFDVEYDNDAEKLLADMTFAEGEHATETELKLRILEIYNAKLDERERRKAFVIERGLLDYKRLLAVERRRPREEREIYDAFRPFARFMSASEFEELVRGIILEQRLRRRITQLQASREEGGRGSALLADRRRRCRCRSTAVRASGRWPRRSSSRRAGGRGSSRPR